MAKKHIFGLSIILSKLFFVSQLGKKNNANSSKSNIGKDNGFRILSKEEVEADRSNAYKYVC